jgi:hypothetical protein
MDLLNNLVVLVFGVKQFLVNEKTFFLLNNLMDPSLHHVIKNTCHFYHQEGHWKFNCPYLKDKDSQV